MAPRKAIDGVLLLDKPAGLTSTQALQQAKHALGAEKAGHTGTLDPMATGLLPLCFGEATKFSRFLLEGDKSYLATIKFGMATDTGDKEGQVIDKKDAYVNEESLKKVLLSFLGTHIQYPPMYSALKKDGKPLYVYARQGLNVDRKGRKITLHTLELLSYTDTEAALYIHCSSGTYIRTLGEDIAKKLGTVGHLISLRRLKSSHFIVENSHPLDDFKKKTDSEKRALLLPITALLPSFPTLTLAEDQCQKIKNGLPVQIALNCAIISFFTLFDSKGKFLGVGTYQAAEKKLKALRLLSTRG